MPLGNDFVAKQSNLSALPLDGAEKALFFVLVYNIPKQMYITMGIDVKLFLFPEALVARTDPGFARPDG